MLTTKTQPLWHRLFKSNESVASNLGPAFEDRESRCIRELVGRFRRRCCNFRILKMLSEVVFLPKIVRSRSRCGG